MKVLLFLMKRFWMKQNAPRSVRVMQGVVLIGVALSVAALIITLSVTSGFERDYKKGLLAFNAHIIVLPNEEEILLEETLQKAFQEAHVPQAKLVSITPYLYREALLIHQGVIKGVVLKGTHRRKSEIRNPKSEIILGDSLAQKLGIAKGEEIKLLIPTGKEISSKNTKHLKVAGTFRSGLYEFDSQFALLDLKTLQDLFGLSPNVHGFELRLNDPELAPLVAASLEKSLSTSVSVQDWAALNQPLFQALELEKWAFRILMGLMVFVAALNLIGAVLLNIFRNQKTIAILRALGLSASKVCNLFALQGFFLGLGGVFFGAMLGMGVVLALERFRWIPLDPQIYFLEKLPVYFDPMTIFIIALFGLLLVWQSSRIAAGRATRLAIREGLHGPG